MEEKLRKQNDLIEELNEEDYDEEIDDLPQTSLYKIRSWGSDPSVRELITMIKENELLRPSLQRNYVWDKTMASRFIESILLGLPIPSIFLAETNDSKKLIIDGYQRITTIYDYVETGVMHHESKLFKLSNSKTIDQRWRGKAFKELSEDEQRRIKQTTIHAIIFVQESPENGNKSLFELFQRINTGGKVLNNQEIRNCIHQGKFNDLLVQLNDNEQWQILYGAKEPDIRMRDVELILRFFALSQLYKSKPNKNQISLKFTLNDFMEKRINITDNDLSSYRGRWTNAIDLIFKYLGEDAFRNYDSDGAIINKIHPTIFDSIMIASDFVIQNKIEIPDILQSDYENKRINLLSDADYITYITEKTTNLSHIFGRVNLVLNKIFDLGKENE